MYWEQPVQYAALSDIGFCRQNNQDAWVVHLRSDKATWAERGHMFVVADGMGGHAVGELASKLAVDSIPNTYDKLRDEPPLRALRSAIETANEIIHEKGVRNPEFQRMGTTCTALVLSPLGVMIGHVGDSRAYRIRGKHIDQLTSDHSLVWEMIRQRRLSPRDAERLCPRNVITRSLGPEPKVQVDLEGPHPVLPGDVFLLCSDGLSGQLSDAEIGMVASSLPPNEACRLLVNLANLRGGPDNTTVIMIRAGEIPADATSTEVPIQYASDTGGLGWGSFAAWCGVVALFGLGIATAALTERQILGFCLIALSVLALTIWLLFVRRRLTEDSVNLKTESLRDPNSTVAWRPYRSALARVTPAFLEQLDRIEQELARAAREERWPIHVAEHETVSGRARDAVARKKPVEALSAFAASLELLMVGVQWQRRQIQEGRAEKSRTPLPRHRTR